MFAVYVDKVNFLRVFRIPATSDKIMAAIMLDYFPLGIALKAILAPFFFHHKAMHLRHAAEISACETSFSLGGANATAEAAAREVARAECEADFVSHGGGSHATLVSRHLSPLSVLSEEAWEEPTVLVSLVTMGLVLVLLVLFVARERRLRWKVVQQQRTRLLTLPSSQRVKNFRSGRVSRAMGDAAATAATAATSAASSAARKASNTAVNATTAATAATSAASSAARKAVTTVEVRLDANAANADPSAEDEEKQVDSDLVCFRDLGISQLKCMCAPTHTHIPTHTYSHTPNHTHLTTHT